MQDLRCSVRVPEGAWLPVQVEPVEKGRGGGDGGRLLLGRAAAGDEGGGEHGQDGEERESGHGRAA